MIQFLKNKQGKVIPYLNSKALCSFQTPLSEAEKWFSYYDFKNVEEVCVLGGGGGFHLHYLTLRQPHLKIHVFDFVPEIVDYLDSAWEGQKNIYFHVLNDKMRSNQLDKIMTWIQDKMPTIMAFRPAWQNHQDDYEKLLMQMTKRKVGVLEKNWEDAALDIHVDWSRLKEEKNYLSLKNLVQSVELWNTHDSQILGVFSEMMK